ncbi:MAG: creatininase family protein, partial [Armatimonadetes bacterium]|nr:creatininase family protein [Armatimonadota bacterium]
LPHELEQALAEFPVAYVPVGSLEWHGRHLALGNDTLKAYGIMLRAAEAYGGVVVPPTYWGHMGFWKPGCHPGLPPEVVDAVFTAIYQGLVTVGFKVVIGITGHDVKEQVQSLQKAADAIAADGAVGCAMMEGDLYDLPGDQMDHAAHWETSILMCLRPELVQMERIRDEDLSTQDGAREAGIYGRDPRTDASAVLGEQIVARIVENLGAKARELLGER